MCALEIIERQKQNDTWRNWEKKHIHPLNFSYSMRYIKYAAPL